MKYQALQMRIRQAPHRGRLLEQADHLHQTKIHQNFHPDRLQSLVLDHNLNHQRVPVRLTQRQILRVFSDP